MRRVSDSHLFQSLATFQQMSPTAELTPFMKAASEEDDASLEMVGWVERNKTRFIVVDRPYERYSIVNLAHLRVPVPMFSSRFMYQVLARHAGHKINILAASPTIMELRCGLCTDEPSHRRQGMTLSRGLLLFDVVSYDPQSISHQHNVSAPRESRELFDSWSRVEEITVPTGRIAAMRPK